MLEDFLWVFSVYFTTGERRHGFMVQILDLGMFGFDFSFLHWILINRPLETAGYKWSYFYTYLVPVCEYYLFVIFFKVPMHKTLLPCRLQH